MTKYQKPFLSFEEQVNKLINRGIVVQDRKKAVAFLSRVSYYKFSGYTWFFEIPAEIKGDRTHSYPNNVSFESISCLYEFDTELRLLVYSALQDIEIAVKTNIAYILSKEKGTHVLTDYANFTSYKGYAKMIASIESAVEKNKKERFILHHLSKYGEQEPLPIWKVVEILTLGNISTIYENLQDQLKTKISEQASLHPTIYTSWLRSFTVIRNICAHNGRLWNRELAVFPSIFNKNQEWDKIRVLPKRVGAVIFCIKEMQDRHKIDNTKWKQEISGLINNFNCFERDRFLKSIGLFEGWEETDLWKR